MHGETSENISLHALDMARDAMEAMAEAESGEVVYGLYTMTVLVMDEDEGTVEEHAREVQKRIQNRGYGARIEEANAPEALMGTWPGHGYENLRAVPLHSLNLADLLPLTSIWAGQPAVPNPSFPPHSPALMLTATAGQTPFFFTPWVGDVGMQLVLDPIGSGKSTLLGTEAVQFRRYPSAQVFWFDKGYSSYSLCLAVGGHHYDIGADETIAFTPLAGIDEEHEREWALGWLEECVVLQGLTTITPELRRGTVAGTLAAGPDGLCTHPDHVPGHCAGSGGARRAGPLCARRRCGSAPGRGPGQSALQRLYGL
jgi:type IV secretion system protein VirB4